MFLKEWLKQGEVRLAAGPHAERARADSELLLMQIVGLNRAYLIAHSDKLLSVEEAARYEAFIERRANGEPIQQITGEQEFYRMPFQVTSDVLIPRPETELLVERVIHLMPLFHPKSVQFFSFRIIRTGSGAKKRRDDVGNLEVAGWPPRVLDVGTGSGAIAISIAHDWSEAEITAIDLSPAALEVARGNAERLGFADCIRFLQGDLLAPVAGERFEIVVSNPPYVAEADRESLSVEVRDYEPALALFAGDDGLEVHRRLIPAAFDALIPGGFVVLEIGCGQSAAITELLARSGFEQIEFVPDLQGILRVACAQRPI
jgi:release factor glutamine methyltransferase